MSRNNVLLTALGGAAAAVLIANYLKTDKGQQMLSSATDAIKDLSGKATEFAKTNLGNLRTTGKQEMQPS